MPAILYGILPTQSCLWLPYHPQAFYTRHLLQSFPSGVGPDQEASIVNSALELQRTSCTSTSDCFSGASCINGLCTCQSPLVEDHGQVSTCRHVLLTSHTLPLRVISDPVIVGCLDQTLGETHHCHRKRPCKGTSKFKHHHKCASIGQVRSRHGVCMCSVGAHAAVTGRICAVGGATATRERSTVTATAAAASASLVDLAFSHRRSPTGAQPCSPAACYAHTQPL